jgi:hypothetical protein
MKRLLPIVALVVFAGLVYVCWPAHAPKTARAPEPQPALDTAPPSAPVRSTPAAHSDGSTEARDGCAFSANTRVAFNLRFRAKSEITAQLLGQPGGDPVSTESEQRMRMEVVAVEPTNPTQVEPSAVLLAQFVDPHATGTGRLPDALSEPFLLRIDAHCALTGFARARSVSRFDGRVQQAFAYELNTFWSPSDVHARSIDNAIGRARMDVTPYVKDSHRTIVQTVTRYDELWRGKNEAALNFDLAPKHSETTVRMGDGPWFENLDKAERLEGPAGNSANYADAHRVEPNVAALDAAGYAKGKGFIWENLLPMRIPAPRLDDVTALDLRQREAVRHYTPERVKDRFMQRFASGAGIQQVWPELTHYLEARPEETETLVNMMKKDEISTDASPAFYIALGRARTPEAKAALLDIMRDQVAPPVERIRAMFGLVDRNDVGVPLAKEFASMARDITRGHEPAKRVLGREALLALGALAGMQQDEGVTQVAVAAAALTIDEGQDPIERRPGYGALANIGDPTYMNYADEGSREPDARDREAAAIVVRRMHPDETSDFVAAWLAREPDAHVKEAIYTPVDLQTIDYPVPVSPRLIDQALTDLAAKPRVITRKAILNILGRAVQRYPQARQALLRQIPYELQEDSGIYDVIVRYLDPDEVRAAIAHVGREIHRDR